MRRARARARSRPPSRSPAALALGGCGFTPLYATPGVAGGLPHIEVVAPQGRVGYLLREDLDDDLGHAKGDTPLYRLEMVLDRGAPARTASAPTTSPSATSST